MALLTPDSRLIIAARGLRAAGYGCTAVLLGSILAARDYSALEVGLLLGSVVAGTAFGSLLFGNIADRVGRRRCYRLVYAGRAAAGLVLATNPPIGVIAALALLG